MALLALARTLWLFLRLAGFDVPALDDSSDGLNATRHAYLHALRRPPLVIVDGYVRVSQVGRRSGERFMSPDVQREQIERWAHRSGALIGNVFEELDESGGRKDRPLLEEAIRRVESGDSDGIVVAYLSRFGRSLVDGLTAIQRITAAGGTFASVQEGVDFSTDMGRHLLREMLSWAEWERDRVRANWDTAKRRAVARGVLPAARPFGYRKLANGRLAIDPAEGPFVAEVFKRRAAGASVTALCRFLTEAEVKTARGNAIWLDSTLRNMVASRTYRGEIRYGEHVNRRAHKPLVSEATWQRAQRSGTLLPRPRSKQPPLLRGILRCTGCQRLLSAPILFHESSYERRVYQCKPIRAAGRCPAPVNVVDHLVEPYLEAVFWQELARSRRGPTARRLDRLAQDVEHRERQLEAYRDNPRVGSVIGPDRFVEGLAVRSRRLEQARLELSRARMRRAEKLPPAEELRGRWPSMSVVERSHAIAEVIECAFVHRGHCRGAIGGRLSICLRGRGPSGLPPFNPHSPIETHPFDPSTCAPTVGLRRPLPDWTEAQVFNALGPFLKGRTQWPGFTVFQACGLALLYEQVERHGGPSHWAQRFGLPFSPPHTQAGRGWSEARVRQELRAYLADKTAWPNEPQFQADGRGRLRRVITWYGGHEHWAREFGLTRAPRQRTHRRWPYPRIKAELAKFTAGRTEWPTQAEFRAAGLGGLCEAIKRRHLRDQLAREMGLLMPSGRNAGPRRWTDEAIRQALKGLTAGTNRWPPERDFGRAGLWGLLRAIDKTSSREEWARRLGVKPPRRVAPPNPDTLRFA